METTFKIKKTTSYWYHQKKDYFCIIKRTFFCILLRSKLHKNQAFTKPIFYAKKPRKTPFSAHFPTFCPQTAISAHFPHPLFSPATPTPPARKKTSSPTTIRPTYASKRPIKKRKEHVPILATILLRLLRSQVRLRLEPATLGKSKTSFLSAPAETPVSLALGEEFNT